MKHSIKRDIEWHGPYGWPRFEGNLPPIPELPRVYVLTVEYKRGYVIYGAGITRRPMPQRFREHTRSYMNGMYTVLDIPAMQRGIRKEVWHGFWTRARPPERQKEYDKQRPELNEAVCRQLAGYRIFVAHI